MANILIPSPFRQFTQNQAYFESSETSIQTALEALAQAFPDLRQQILDEKGHLQKYITVFVGEEDIQSLQGNETPLDVHSEVSIMPPLRGGAY